MKAIYRDTDQSPPNVLKRKVERPFLNGFTVLEFLVCIAVVSVVLSLVIPAVAKARDSARRVECCNSLKNLAFAMLGNMETYRRFPRARVQGLVGESGGINSRNWVTAILPWIDREDLFKRLDFSKSFEESENLKLTETHISTLVCPADISQAGSGDLSFAVNGGIVTVIGADGGRGYVFCSPFGLTFDLNGDGRFFYSREEPPSEPNELEMVFATALFDGSNNDRSYAPLSFDPAARGHSPSTVLDGMSNTLMIAENIRTGFDPAANHSNWGTTKSECLYVSITTDICKRGECRTGNVDLTVVNSGRRAINTGRLLPEGAAPWPNSFHDDGVNIAFADGHVKFISEAIDSILLFNLYTPQGSRLRSTPLETGVLTQEF